MKLQSIIYHIILACFTACLCAEMYYQEGISLFDSYSLKVNEDGTFVLTETFQHSCSVSGDVYKETEYNGKWKTVDGKRIFKFEKEKFYLMDKELDDGRVELYFSKEDIEKEDHAYIILHSKNITEPVAGTDGVR